MTEEKILHVFRYQAGGVTYEGYENVQTILLLERYYVLSEKVVEVLGRIKNTPVEDDLRAKIGAWWEDHKNLNALFNRHRSDIHKMKPETVKMIIRVRNLREIMLKALEKALKALNNNDPPPEAS